MFKKFLLVLLTVVSPGIALSQPFDDLLQNGGVLPSGEVTNDFIFCGAPIDDSGPPVCTARGAPSFERATVNTTGGTYYIGGGPGTFNFTGITKANCVGDSVSFAVNFGAPTTLVYGTDWCVGGCLTDAAAARSLAATIEILSGVGAYGQTNNVYFLPDGATFRLSLTSSDATCAVAHNGLHGSTYIYGPLTVGGLTMTGPFALAVCQQAHDSATVDIGVIPGGCNTVETSSANVGATAITDFTNALPGMIVKVVGKGGTLPTTISNAGNFHLFEGTWTGYASDEIEFYVQADNNYIETGRTMSANVFTSTGNITLAVTTAGSDIPVATRPSKIAAGDYSTIPYLTIQAAINALPNVLKNAHTATINVGAGTFAGFQIDSTIQGNTVTVAGTRATSTPVTGPDSGVATAGGVRTLTLAAAGWTVDDLVGRYLNITAGTGSGNTLIIAANTADTITTADALTMAVGSTFTLQDLATVITPGWSGSYGVSVYHVYGKTQLTDLKITAASTVGLFSKGNLNLGLTRVIASGQAYGIYDQDTQYFLPIQVGALSNASYGLWLAGNSLVGDSTARGIFIKSCAGTGAYIDTLTALIFDGLYIRNNTGTTALSLYHANVAQFLNTELIDVKVGASLWRSNVVFTTLDITNATTTPFQYLYGSDIDFQTAFTGTGNTGYGLNLHDSRARINLGVTPTIAGTSGDFTIDGATVETWATVRARGAGLISDNNYVYSDYIEASAVTVKGDITMYGTADLIGLDDSYWPTLTADTLPNSGNRIMQHAWSQATTAANQKGGNQLVMNGLGSRKTVFTAAGSAGKTITIVHNADKVAAVSTTTVYTADAGGWTCSTVTDAECACNLYTIITGTPVSGWTVQKSSVGCTDKTLYWQPDPLTWHLWIVSQLPFVDTAMQDGTVYIGGPLATSNTSCDRGLALAFGSDTDTGFCPSALGNYELFQVGGSVPLILSTTAGYLSNGYIANEGYFHQGAPGTNTVTMQSSSSKDQFLLTTHDGAGNAVVVASNASLNHDCAHADPTDPRIYVHSDNDCATSPTEWMGIGHDKTDAVIETGKGGIVTSGIGATSAEDLKIRYGDTGNQIDLSSTTGVTTIDVGTMALAATGFDNSEGDITNVENVHLDMIYADADPGTKSYWSTGGFFGDEFSDNGAGGAEQACAVLSASPADGDLLCNKTSKGKDSGGNWITYVNTTSEIQDPTAAADSQEGIQRFRIKDGSGAALVEYMRLDGTDGVRGLVYTAPSTFNNTLTIDNATTGSTVDSYALTLSGNNFSGGVNYQTDAALQTISGADPYLRFSVDDTGLAGHTLTPVFDVHDTVLAFVTDNTVDIGTASANRPKNLYLSGTVTSTGASVVGANGETAGFAYATTTLTFAGNPGDASKTAIALNPIGSQLQAIVTRVLVAGTNCTSFSIGDGVDPDLWGSTIALTAGTTTTNANATANWSNPQLAAGNVVLTANGGNCFDLSVRVVASYIAVTAPTN
jgi:hypothetical protein